MGRGVSVGATTCRCTAGDLSDERVAPNESATVTIRWEPDGATKKFQQSANILTNDPDRPVVKLTIRGWVTQRLRAEPQSIILGGVTADQGRTVQFNLFSYYDDHFEIVDHRWATFIAIASLTGVMAIGHVDPYLLLPGPGAEVDQQAAAGEG